MNLQGVSLIAGREAATAGAAFRAINPATGSAIDPPFFSATEEDVDRAARAAQEAFLVWRKRPARERARLLPSRRPLSLGLPRQARVLFPCHRRSRRNLPTRLH